MRIPLGVLAGLVAFLVAGCSGLPQLPGLPGLPGLPRPPTSGSPPATAGPPTAAPDEPESPDRPRPAVPDVRVDGITTAPPGQGLDRYRQQQVDWRSCPGGQAEQRCAQVRAPLDWSDPDGDALTLFLRRVPATREPRLGTIFVNPGGPGEPGSGLAASFQREGLEQFDIVGWDPRGTGRSTPIRCASGDALDEYYEVDVSPDDPGEREELITASGQLGESCLVNSGRLLAHISTVDTVTDLDLLRGLVGDDKLNFFGYSYGTAIGSRYAHTYPDRVGRVALDGAVNITESEDVIQAVGFDRALAAFADWCVTNECSLGRDREQVLQAVTGLLDGLDERPLPVADRELTQSLAVTGVVVALYGAEAEWRLLLTAVQRAQAGDGDLLLRMADFYNARDDSGDYDTRLTAFAAIRCLDEGDHGLAGADRRAQIQTEKAPILGPYFGPDYVCPTWPVPPIPEPEPVVAAGAAPILVIGSTGDSATPYEFARAMAEQLESGVLLTYDGPGHGAYGGRSACIDEAVVRYFTQEPPTEDRTCR